MSSKVPSLEAGSYVKISNGKYEPRVIDVITLISVGQAERTWYQNFNQLDKKLICSILLSQSHNDDLPDVGYYHSCNVLLGCYENMYGPWIKLYILVEA